MFFTRSISNSKGFSLIEITWVMVCMGILMTIAVPSFVGYLRTSRLTGSSNELLADLHYARSLAVSKRQSYRVEFDVDEYRIVQISSGDIVRQRSLATGLSCAATADPVFYAWGLADPVNITISGPANTRSLALSANGNVTHF